MKGYIFFGAEVDTSNETYTSDKLDSVQDSKEFQVIYIGEVPCIAFRESVQEFGWVRPDTLKTENIYVRYGWYERLWQIAYELKISLKKEGWFCGCSCT